MIFLNLRRSLRYGDNSILTLSFLFFSLFSSFKICKLLFDMLDNFLNNYVFSFFFTISSQFSYEGIVSILDHMLSSSVVEDRNQLRPFLSYFGNKIKNNQVFLRAPVTVFLFLIQMIKPSFTAMFGTFEYFKVWFEENVSRNLIPFSLFRYLNCFSEDSIFFRCPNDFTIWLQHV